MNLASLRGEANVLVEAFDGILAFSHKLEAENGIPGLEVARQNEFRITLLLYAEQGMG